MQNQPRLQNCHTVLVLYAVEQGESLHTQRSLSEKVGAREHKERVNHADYFAVAYNRP